MPPKPGSTAPRFHVAIIAYDEPFSPPEWISEEFNRAGIELSLTNCYTEAEVITLARDKDVLLTSSARKLLTREVIQQLSGCRALVRVGSGVDCIDIPTATAYGIVVVNTPEALVEEVSDHAAALLLDCIRRISYQDRLVRQGQWRSPTMPSVPRIRGKTLGLIGLGRIARALMEKLSGFKLTFLAYDPYIDPAMANSRGARSVTLDELLREADFVSLHLPLTEETRHLLGERELHLMKHQAILINTARGAIVDELALYRALTQGWIAGAGLDVLEQEPPAPDNPFLQLQNVVLTPHTAASSDELMEAMYRAGCQVTKDLLDGRRPSAIINPEVRPWWATEEKSQ